DQPPDREVCFWKSGHLGPDLPFTLPPLARGSPVEGLAVPVRRAHQIRRAEGDLAHRHENARARRRSLTHISSPISRMTDGGRAVPALAAAGSSTAGEG